MNDRSALEDAQRAARTALTRLTLARASMRAALKHDDLDQLRSWLEAAEDNRWLEEIADLLGDGNGYPPIPASGVARDGEET